MADSSSGWPQALWQTLGLSGRESAGQSRLSSLTPGLTVQNPDQGAAPRQAQLFARLWLGFLMARIMAGVVLALAPVLWAYLRPSTAPEAGLGLHAGAIAYLLLAVVQRWQVGAGRTVQFSRRLVGVCVVLDILAIALLNHSSIRTLHLYPLLALPLLYVSVLGNRLQALGTAAAVALLLLADVWGEGGWPPEDSTQLLQAGLKGAGAMVGAWVINQLAARLDEAVRHAEVNQAAARAQVRINDLVMSEMTEGVLVADEQARVRMANPAAWALLGWGEARVLPLGAWLELDALVALRDFVMQTFVAQQVGLAEVEVRLPDGALRRLRLKGRLTASPGPDGREHYLCVVFMEDMQEVQARVRQEKMASMGRMSAAVAHEIRNPLAAIVQANALLHEELTQAQGKKMTQIVAQNAQRIAQTVEEVLDVSRYPQGNALASVALVDQVLKVCEDWHALHGQDLTVHHAPGLESRRVRFDAEHLRRLLVNLLDNTRKHAKGAHREKVVVLMDEVALGARLVVWNGGDPLDASIQAHLYEPFFSSDARSSGLGLYICRQLCEAHQADLSFSRSPMPLSDPASPPLEGNQFVVRLVWAADTADAPKELT